MVAVDAIGSIEGVDVLGNEHRHAAIVVWIDVVVLPISRACPKTRCGVFVNHGNLKTKEIYSDMITDNLNVEFVEILDRSIFYSMSEYTVLKFSNSKFPTLIDYKNSCRKERKERKLLSKKNKPKFKRPNHLCKKISVFFYH